jgi:signal transduction histidine kinase/ActR/RegA family two-component response regulator
MKKCGVQNAQTLYDLDKTGFWGEAVRQRIPIVINDYQANNPQKKGIPEGHVKLLNFLTIPVIFDQQIVAVIGVANKATDYNNSDIRQLTLLMDTVWKFSERITLIDDLKFAKDKAEENDRLKSAFLANMSHEIRTPMNGILGFTGLLKKPELTGEKQQLYISMIEKGGARMLNIINDIISISKVESGQMEVSISESNVNEKLEFIYTFFKPEVQRKGMQMSFHTSLPAREAVIKTDREKVSAILTCLVKNAVEYTFSGTIEFGYVLKPVKKSGDNKDIASAELEFYVKDTGIGIPQDKMEAIFERFVQADNGDKRAYQGAGLGLSISKAYVEMLGGKIWVESEVGKGSTFYFTIPYHNEPKGIIAVEKVVAPDKEEPQIKKLKILITDDDESSAMLLTEIVKKYGKEFLYAENGVEASEACRNNPDLDLVLMDIQMPIMDGYEATKQIRQFNKKIVIIAQTAYVRDGDRAKAIDAGCNDYVSKPINHSLITELIKKYYKES